MAAFEARSPTGWCLQPRHPPTRTGMPLPGTGGLRDRLQLQALVKGHHAVAAQMGLLSVSQGHTVSECLGVSAGHCRPILAALQAGPALGRQTQAMGTAEGHQAWTQARGPPAQHLHWDPLMASPSESQATCWTLASPGWPCPHVSGPEQLWVGHIVPCSHVSSGVPGVALQGPLASVCCPGCRPPHRPHLEKSAPQQERQSCHSTSWSL